MKEDLKLIQKQKLQFVALKENEQLITAAELLHVTRKHDRSTGRTIGELAVTAALQ
jgi:predicted N-acetyltransferase YhbS